ncbi:MAG TPA: EamA family transporter [Polyangiaceae bacterium]|nr:EamA family transporter [Polyangiaceae bacterium]
MSPRTRAWLEMHVCVVLWGFTAILGKLITLQALPLVWWRMTFVTAALLFVRPFWRGVASLSTRSIAILAGTGVLLALHWVTFYAAVKLANASVAATCIALTPVAIAFIDPWVGRRPFDFRELWFGLAVLPGVVLVVGGTPTEMQAGILVGVASALFVALVSCLNKRFAAGASALGVTGIEMAAGVVFLPLCVPLGAALLLSSEPLFVLPAAHDIGLLAALAFGCTLLPFALSLVALRELSAFDSALATNLEPVYTILLAIPIFGEQLELGVRFYAGAAIVLAVVFMHPFLGRSGLAAKSRQLAR